MIDDFLPKLGVPPACKLDRVVFKKLFSDNADLDVTDKKALKDDVGKVRWIYTLKPSTINIEPYKDEEREYLEVAILGVALEKPERVRRIATFMHKAIPYPLVVVFGHGDQLAVSVAHKRINQADRSKWVVGDIWITPWFSAVNPIKPAHAFTADCTMASLPFTNFLAFYSALGDRVIAFNVAERTGSYTLAPPETTEKRIECLDEIDRLTREISELRTKLKKAGQMATQIKLNVEIKRRKDGIVRLTNRLSS